MTQTHAIELRPADIHRESKRGGRYSPRVPRPGEVFGLLTIVQLHEQIDGRRIWQCACQCGAPQLRSTAELNVLARSGRIDACPSCASGLAQHRKSSRANWRREAWRRLWEARRTLYGDRAVRLLCEGVQDALERDVAPLRDARWEEDSPQALTDDRRPRHTQSQQRMAVLYPLSIDNPETPADLRWECVHCNAIVERCFGCVECLETACVDCVREERHAHRDEREAQLMRIARALALDGKDEALIDKQLRTTSIENVRRICEMGLRRMSHDAALQAFAPEDSYVPRAAYASSNIFDLAHERAEGFLWWLRLRHEPVAKFMRKLAVLPRQVVSLRAFRTFLEKSGASRIVIDGSEQAWNEYRRSLHLPSEHLLDEQETREHNLKSNQRNQRDADNVQARIAAVSIHDRDIIATFRQQQKERFRRQHQSIVPCPCMSGLLFEHCHGKVESET